VKGRAVRRCRALIASLICVGTLAPVALVLSSSAASAAPATLAYTAAAPQLATLTDGANQAPWDEFQGDGGAGESLESVLPTYTPSGGSTDVDGYPNLAVVSSATSTDSSVPYPSGTVGTPGPLDGYCGPGNLAQEDAGTPALQPIGTTLPLAPAYFPYIVPNADGSLTGYFDYRPKDANEAIVVANSTDQGHDWTYEGEALEQDPGYCPSSDTNDDGEGHPSVYTIDGSTFLYTLPRAAGDNLGVGMLVHKLNPTASDPLAGAPAVEQNGLDPDDFAASAVTVPTSGGAAVTIPFTEPVGIGADALVAGDFVDETATPTANGSQMIDCTGVGTASLTGCTTTGAAAIQVSRQDLIEQVIATAASSATVPQGPNTETADGGLATLSVDVTNANNLTMALFNNGAPGRLYIDGATVYCAQSNADPTSKIENCTTTTAGGLSVASGDPVTADPLVPATATAMTTGLVAPDGIVGVLPSYPGAPGGSTVLMYTEKIINYFDIGYTGSSTTFKKLGADGSATVPYTNFWNTASAPAGSGSAYSFSIGDDTSSQPVTVTCTGQTTTSTGGTFTGCSYPSTVAGDTISKNSYLVAPGGATSTSATRGDIGEGDNTNAQKMFKNNEDLSLLRVAYTTDGVDFSDAGLANDGILSGTGAESAVNATSGAVTCTPANEAPPTGYADITDPCATVSPSNLNAYAGNDAANGTGPSSGGSDINGTSLTDEMRWVGSAGSIITNPNGTYGLFLSGAWENDGDSDAFNQIFYSTSTNGEDWSVPVSVVSTDYSFAASADAAANPTSAFGIGAYYSGRAYDPTVVENPTNGTLTMLFAGDQYPKSIESAGSVLGTGSTQFTVPSGSPLLYRNILQTTLTPAAQTATTSTGLTSTDSGAGNVGSAVTYTATVSPQFTGTSFAPTGSVTFGDGASAITSCNGGTTTVALNASGIATCTTTEPTTSGGDLVTATYNGDNNYSGSSDTLAEAIAAAPTTVAVTSSDNGQGVVGEAITYTATVSSSSSSSTLPSPTGTVAFSDAAGPLGCGTEPVDPTTGTASCTEAYASPTTDAITASYAGDGTYAGSTSPTITETIAKAQTTVTLTSSNSGHARSDSPVTYTATVSVVAPGAGSPTGTVTFTDNGKAIGACPAATLSGDTATCTVTYTAAEAGSHDIVATYSGSTSYGAATSPTLVEAVAVPTTLTAGAHPPVVVYGEPVELSAAGLPVAATGTVTFSTPAGSLCSAAVRHGRARCAATGAIAPGSYTVTATYSGDGTYAGSTTTFPLVVEKDPSFVSVGAFPAVVAYGSTVTIHATVFPGSATGTVTFTSGSATWCAAAPIANAAASCVTPTDLAPGRYAVTATYSGDADTSGSSDTTFIEVTKTPTSLSVSATPTLASAGSTIKLTAAIFPSSATGTVVFTSGFTPLCTATISDGVATCTVPSTLPAGSYFVTATYGGSADDASSSAYTSFTVTGHGFPPVYPPLFI
jgi:large repetitive protein